VPEHTHTDPDIDPGTDSGTGTGTGDRGNATGTTVGDDRRLSDVEALMWVLEKDPSLASTMVNVTVFDRPPDLGRLRARMAKATEAVPKLHQRVVTDLGGLWAPEWRDDPDFDLDRHLRVAHLPAPGGDRQLYDLAADMAATPFDRDRPLWEFVVVEGLDGGRGAMVQKMHHTITDGEGGIRMSVEFIDIERDPVGPLAVASRGTQSSPEPSAESGQDRTAEKTSAATEAVHVLENLFGSLEHNVRRQAEAARRAFGSAVEVARDPARLVALPTEAAETVQALVRQVTIDGRRSPLWTDRSLRHHFDAFWLPFDDAKATAKALGGSINDLFVTGAAGGAGAYHRALGTDVAELRMAMPVSTRTTKTAGGNAFTPTRVLVPTTADPRERFAKVRQRLTQTKGDKSVGLYQAVAGVVTALPPPLLIRLAKAQTDTVDFTTSNVRAAPFDLFIAGALMTGNYPLGPLGGTAFNLTTMSYRGRLDLGLHVDPGAVQEPDLLLRCLTDSFGELLALQ